MDVLGAGVTLDRSVFSSNTAISAGGGVVMSSASIDAVNTAFFGNTAPMGGALAASSGDNTLSLLHCTLAGNTAPSGGAIYGVSDVAVAGSVLWNPAAPEELHSCGSKGLDVSYSDVRGQQGGSANLDADPKFVDLAGGDLHLQASSPCIDAANPAGAPATDLLGKPRAGVPDMGAYEYP